MQPWLGTEPSAYSGSATSGASEPRGRAGGDDRPPRPEKYDAPDLSDEMWGLEETGAAGPRDLDR